MLRCLNLLPVLLSAVAVSGVDLNSARLLMTRRNLRSQEESTWTGDGGGRGCPASSVFTCCFVHHYPPDCCSLASACREKKQTGSKCDEATAGCQGLGGPMTYGRMSFRETTASRGSLDAGEKQPT